MKRQDYLFEVYKELLQEAKMNGGSVVHYTLQGQRHDYDFTVIRANGTKKNIKVYTSSSPKSNTALSENVLKNSSLDYIILYAKGNGIGVFKKEDVVNAGNITTDGRKHFSNIISNMPSSTIVTSASNFRRLFIEF